VDFELTADQREIQSLAREFARGRIAPHAADWDREHAFPRELLTELAAAQAQTSSRTSSCSRSCRARTRASA
jgi:alkylation response protein AidB-like acyl-CoA dehydrogenase